ncbi:MAG: isochorismatase family protein [Methylicorpusculum sp.]|uniref:isochorismatase family protein n=1 Tax=Methylicorpusculum sp. TaxID=2713644 RepID=UPI002716ACA4|nr:isochorismatase family protein [Methylicorpusculum sp.]MDO8843411.1 isochorismatase family protein [Methylicorpusculum sp.]MDO8939532.1 isochorismatase family protein [Methylicorpusculum sp.]MDP2204564.1 isochorismatase family protein [Methylicorpusculum sp.]
MIDHANLIAAENSVLLIVDMQAKLTASMPQADAELMIANTGKLIEAANTLAIPIFVTEQYPQGLGSTETAVLNRLPVHSKTYPKTSFSCCEAEGFTQALEQTERRKIILVGQEAHICVLQTALALMALGYQAYIVEDAVCSRNPTHKTNALQRMQLQGATVANYESVLFEWLKDAQHPDFKTLSALVR